MCFVFVAVAIGSRFWRRSESKMDVPGRMLHEVSVTAGEQTQRKERKKSKWDRGSFFFVSLFFWNKGITVELRIFYLTTVNNLHVFSSKGCRVRVHARLHPPSNCNKKKNKKNKTGCFRCCFFSQDGCCPCVACLLCRSRKRTTRPQSGSSSCSPAPCPSPNPLLTPVNMTARSQSVEQCYKFCMTFFNFCLWIIVTLVWDLVADALPFELFFFPE